MLYRPPSRPPVTAWAKHLDQVMQDRDWSRVRLFEEVGAELGYGPKSRSAILPLLIDKEPTPDQRVILMRHFGEPPQPAPEPTTATETPDPLVVALRDQTAAITALVGELSRWRTEDRPRLAQVEAMLNGLVSGSLGAPGTPTVAAPPVHDGTTV